MGTKLISKDAELYQAVDEVLHYIWDPIGISDVQRARDEYHSYLPQVFELLCQGAAPESIASYLGKMTTESMGLSVNAKHDLRVAGLLIDWKEAIDEKFA